jgi:hypothetical protein
MLPLAPSLFGLILSRWPKVGNESISEADLRCEQIYRQRCEEAASKKKTSEKALIPLPPTGFASVFCAIPDVVQTNLQSKRAVGICRRSAISQSAKF